MNAGIELPQEDEYNAILLNNTHPADLVNPVPQNPYNLVVMGAGTAGLVCAAGAATLGARVALIEKNLMGGDCLNYGCVPSKAIIRSALTVADVREADRFGVRVRGEPAVDFEAVMGRMRRLRAHISRNDSVWRYSRMGVDVFLGAARFVGPRALEVGGQTLRFSRAVIATGARPAIPPIPGLEKSGYLTNETVFNLRAAPLRLAVIGGGPIGCEMAQAFQRLGSQVTVIQRSGHLLEKEDVDAAEIVQEALRRDGVELALRATKILSVEQNGPERRIRYLGEGRGECEVTVDQILVAAGRAPNVGGIGLEEVDVEFDDQEGVIVDDRLRTTNRRIFAAGDVCSRYKFTHAADFMARTVLANALFMGRRKVSTLTIPWCTYTDPQVAHVGYSEAGAMAAGLGIETFTVRLEHVDRALLDGEAEGFVKVHVKRGTDRIVGATVVARHAGEMIGEITLAMTQRLGLRALANVIHPYPTQAEAVRRTGDLYLRTRLTPFVQRLLTTWLNWKRGR